MSQNDEIKKKEKFLEEKNLKISQNSLKGEEMSYGEAEFITMLNE